MTTTKTRIIGCEEGDHPHIIATGKREQLVVKGATYKGNRRLSIRFHYVDEEGNLAPGSRGIEIPISFANEVLEAMEEVLEAEQDS